MKLAREQTEGGDTGRAGEPARAGLDQLRLAFESKKQDGLTLHAALRAGILDTLAQGVWAAGDKLPAETQVAGAVGLSLGTVQKVLTQLARDGILLRRHGRGTFVTGADNQSEQLLHFRFVGDDAAIVPVYAEALGRDVVENREWRHFLPNAARLIRIARRITVGDEFDCLSEFYVDAERFKPVLDMPFEDLHRTIIRNLLARQFNAPTLSITQRVYSTEFPEHVQQQLPLAPNKNFGLVLEIFSYSHAQTPISVQNIFVPGGARRLEIPSPRLVR